jgi:acetyltransferase-like isoleucine patch superfamily enzyme
MAATSFYSHAELADLGLGAYGDHVLISRKASLYGPQNLFLGSHVRIDDFAVLSAGSPGIHVGSYVHIACFCMLQGGSGITLEDFCGLSSRVSIYSETEDFSGASLTNPTVPMAFKPRYRRGAVVLRRHALVGTNSTILPGVTVEEGVAVGAHSLVIRPCKAWSVYVGSPAVRVKDRLRDILQLERALLGDHSPGQDVSGDSH